jgi:hypothetical protein
MVDHRKHSVAHAGLLYDEMRRLGKYKFCVELIENYPCGNKEELVATLQFYIRERGTLNNRATKDGTALTNRATKDGTEHAYVKSDIIQLKVLVYELHAKISQIETQTDALLNHVYMHREYQHRYRSMNKNRKRNGNKQ